MVEWVCPLGAAWEKASVFRERKNCEQRPVFSRAKNCGSFVFPRNTKQCVPVGTHCCGSLPFGELGFGSAKGQYFPLPEKLWCLRDSEEHEAMRSGGYALGLGPATRVTNGWPFVRGDDISLGL